MARAKKKATKKKAKKQERSYATPKDQFVYSPEHITLVELGKCWKGIPGAGFQNLVFKSAKEGWVKEREKFQNKVRAETMEKVSREIAERNKVNIVRVNESHLAGGVKLFNIGFDKFNKPITLECPKCKKKIVLAAAKDLMKPSECIRAIAAGVDMQRKALGLADKVVGVQLTKEITVHVIEVLKKHIPDSATFRNIVKDLQAIDEDSRNEVEEITTRKLIDVTPTKKD